MQDRTSARSTKPSCNARPDHTLGRVLVETLRPFPEAAAKVAAALHAIESDVAKVITDSKRPLVIDHIGGAPC
jgi:hypothetical protein